MATNNDARTQRRSHAMMRWVCVCGCVMSNVDARYDAWHRRAKWCCQFRCWVQRPKYYHREIEINWCVGCAYRHASASVCVEPIVWTFVRLLCILAACWAERGWSYKRSPARNFSTLNVCAGGIYTYDFERKYRIRCSISLYIYISHNWCGAVDAWK